MVTGRGPDQALDQASIGQRAPGASLPASRPSYSQSAAGEAHCVAGTAMVLDWNAVDWQPAVAEQDAELAHCVVSAWRPQDVCEQACHADHYGVSHERLRRGARVWDCYYVP